MIAELYPSVEPDGVTYNHRSSCESHSNEPVLPVPIDPESVTDNPPNLTTGVAVLTVIILVPTLNWDDVTYKIEDVPNTVKFWVINNDPDIVASLKDDDAATDNVLFKLVAPLTVKLPVTIALPTAVILFPINSLPLNVKLPILDKDNKVDEPDTIWKDVVPGNTDADTDPVAVWDKFNPTIEDAGNSVNPLPLPRNEPENEPDPTPVTNPENEPVDVPWNEPENNPVADPWNDPDAEPDNAPTTVPVNNPVALILPCNDPENEPE